MDRESDPGDKPVDRHSNRSGKLHLALSSTCPGLFEMG